MNFYKITDLSILEQIELFNNKKEQLIQSFHDFAEKVESKHPFIKDSIQSGIQLIAVGVHIDEIDTVDLSKWRIQRYTSSLIATLVPRRANKAFCQFYAEHFPKDKLYYDDLFNLIFKQPLCPNIVVPSHFHLKKGEYLIFQAPMQNYNQSVLKITKSEYHKLKLMKETT